MECIVCLKTDGKKKHVTPPSLDSQQKVLERLRERAKYKDGPVMENVERSKDVVPVILSTDKITYHKDCYANIANTAKLDRAKQQLRSMATRV